MIADQRSSEELSGRGPESRRLLDIAKLDLWGQGEVSPTRLLAGSIAFAVSVAMAVLLLAGA